MFLLWMSYAINPDGYRSRTIIILILSDKKSMQGSLNCYGHGEHHTEYGLTFNLDQFWPFGLTFNLNFYGRGENFIKYGKCTANV